jgi:hypothetical protein
MPLGLLRDFQGVPGKPRPLGRFYRPRYEK